MARAGLLLAPLTLFLARPLLALRVVLGSLALRSLFLALRPRCLLPTLACPLLLLLLPLILDCRAFLLRRGLGWG